MTFYLTYIYKGIKLDREVGGIGSSTSTVKGNMLTKKIINELMNEVKNALENDGIKIRNVAPVGVFKLDEEEINADEASDNDR